MAVQFVRTTSGYSSWMPAVVGFMQVHAAKAASAPGLGPPLPDLCRDRAHLPHLHRGRAHPSHICAGTGLTSPTSTLGLVPPLPHLRADWAHPRHITGVMQWANWARLAILSTTQNLYALAAPTLARITADVGFHVGLDVRFEPAKFDALLLDRLGSVGMLLVVLVCCVYVARMLHVAWVCCTNMLHVALVHRMGMLRGYGAYCRLHVAWNTVLHRHVACCMLPRCAAHVACGMVCVLHAERCR